MLAVSLWHSDKISISHTGDSGFEYSNTFCLKIIFMTEFSENIQGKLECSWFYANKINTLSLKSLRFFMDKCKFYSSLSFDIGLSVHFLWKRI